MKPAPLLGLALASATLLLLATAPVTRADHPAPATNSITASDAALIERGRYLVRIAGCNDCHTEGYPESGGETPEAQWLTGGKMGYRGPWGTTYAPNLRLRAQDFDEAGWLAFTGALRTRPIMPDFNVRAMSEDDRRAIYRWLRAMGPAGEPAPSYLPPDQAPSPPYFEVVLPPPTPTVADGKRE